MGSKFRRVEFPDDESSENVMHWFTLIFDLAFTTNLETIMWIAITSDMKCATQSSVFVALCMLVCVSKVWSSSKYTPQDHSHKVNTAIALRTAQAVPPPIEDTLHSAPNLNLHINFDVGKATRQLDPRKTKCSLPWTKHTGKDILSKWRHHQKSKSRNIDNKIPVRQKALPWSELPVVLRRSDFLLTTWTVSFWLQSNHSHFFLH